MELSYKNRIVLSVKNYDKRKRKHMLKSFSLSKSQYFPIIKVYPNSLI